jgi:hypothetical protein
MGEGKWLLMGFLLGDDSDPWMFLSVSGIAESQAIWFFNFSEVASQARVAHACNPSYSGVRDQEDRGSWDPILKNPLQKKAGGVAQGVGPELKAQYHQK